MELRDENKKLEKECEVKLNDPKDGRMYSLPLRQAVYHCARRQVPVGHISSVISACVKLMCNKELSPMPHQSTVINMIAEMKILSMCQATESMLKSNYVNIAWDATTIKTDHIDQIHINTDTGGYMLYYPAFLRYDNEGYFVHIKST